MTNKVKEMQWVSLFIDRNTILLELNIFRKKCSTKSKINLTYNIFRIQDDFIVYNI